MKIRIRVLLSLTMIIALIFSQVPAAAVVTPEAYGNSIVEAMQNEDAILSSLSEEYGIESTYSKTTYFVTEYLLQTPSPASPAALQEESLSTITTSFDEYPANYIAQIESQLSQNVITPGQGTMVDYSVIQVTLSYSKVLYTDEDMYYVSNSFVWLELPAPGYLTGIDGVIGLAFAPQLSIDGQSLQGHLYYDRYVLPGGGSGSNIREAITFDVPTTVNSFGGTFSFTHQHGQGLSDYLTALSGSVGCIAYKSNENDEYCSVLAVYEDVASFGLSDEVSISYPAGVSFSFGASHTTYNVQDSLTLR